MKKLSQLTLIAALIVNISSCAFLDKLSKPQMSELDSLEKGGTKMDYKKFFTGDIEYFAITKNAEDKIISTQTAKINGKWDENKGVVQQNFFNSDGSKDSRTWLITLNADGTFEASGHNVASEAKGRQTGNAAQLFYSLMLKTAEGKEEVNFDDKIYLVDDKSAIMVSKSKKKSGSIITTTVSLKKIAAN